MGEKTKKDKKKGAETAEESSSKKDKKKGKKKDDEKAVKSDDKKKDKKEKKDKDDKKEKKEKKAKKEKDKDKDKDKDSKKKKEKKDKKEKKKDDDKKKSKKEDKDKKKKDKDKEKDKDKDKDKDKEKKADKKDKDKEKAKPDDKTSKKATKKSSSSSKDDTPVETVCCICKDHNVDASAGGLCPHVFCLPCLEGLLHKPMKDPQQNDNHLASPTLGRCPKCHAELRQFEVKDTKTGKLKYERNTNISEAPIFGKVYRPKDRDMQLGNFGFDEDPPYMDFQSAIAQDKDLWLMNDGSQAPERKYFEKGCHFDAKSRTFHGTILWKGVTFQGAHQWDTVLGFNKDFTDIHVGIIHERKDRQLDSKTMEKIDPEELPRHLYPLDGKWKLLWKTVDGKDMTGSITVRNNEFQQGPYLFNLNFDDPATPKFRWPLDPVYATAKSGVNLKKKPMGPKVGERLVWETTHPAFKEITWERETIGEMPIQRTVHFGVGNNEYTSVTVEEVKEEEEDKGEKDTSSAKEAPTEEEEPAAAAKSTKASKKDDSSASGSSSGGGSDSDSDSSSGSSSGSGSDSGSDDDSSSGSDSDSS